MEILIDLLKSAKGEIIAGILFALLGWVYSRFRRITRLYKRQKQKQKLERMKDDFIELCKSGDAGKIEEAIMNGANVNAKDNDSTTALMLAAISGQTEAVKILLNHGANINARDIWGYTALKEAKMWGRTEVAKLLRRNGAK